MVLTQQRQTILQIVNRVQRKQAINETTTLTQTKNATVLLDMLNEVVSELGDYGRWQELYRNVEITAQSSVGDYTIAVSAVVHDVFEIVYDNQIAPLEVRDLEDIRRLQRIGSFGTPRQFGIIGVNASTGNPIFGVYPIPGQVEAGNPFQVAYYIKPPLYETTDANVIVPFPADVVFQGVYAKALLEDNGGEPTRQYQLAYAEYERMKNAALNRYNSSTGTDTYLQPTGPRY